MLYFICLILLGLLILCQSFCFCLNSSNKCQRILAYCFAAGLYGLAALLLSFVIGIGNCGLITAFYGLSFASCLLAAILFTLFLRLKLATSQRHPIPPPQATQTTPLAQTLTNPALPPPNYYGAVNYGAGGGIQYYTSVPPPIGVPAAAGLYPVAGPQPPWYSAAAGQYPPNPWHSNSTAASGAAGVSGPVFCELNVNNSDEFPRVYTPDSPVPSVVAEE